jgi:hypothetical protein
MLCVHGDDAECCICTAGLRPAFFEFALNRLNFALESSPANIRTAGLWPAHYPVWFAGRAPTAKPIHGSRLQRNS